MIQGSPDVGGLSAPPSSGYYLYTCENDAELVPHTAVRLHTKGGSVENDGKE